MTGKFKQANSRKALSLNVMKRKQVTNTNHDQNVIMNILNEKGQVPFRWLNTVNLEVIDLQ